MINLIKNELTKIFHKRAIYVLGIITIIWGITLAILPAILTKNSLYENANNESFNNIEESLKHFNLNNPDEAKWYIVKLTNYELYKEYSKYDYYSWQKQYIESKGKPLVTCRNEAKYIEKDNDKYRKCNLEFENLIKDIAIQDWQYFVNLDKNKIINEKIALENELKETTDKNRVYELKQSIQKLEYKIEGLNFRLKNNVEPNDTNINSVLIDDYIYYSQSYLEANKDKKSYTDKEELKEFKELEKNYYTTKYKIDNNILSKSKFPISSTDIISIETSITILFVLVTVAMIAGTIVGEEYNKGTIKQLLLKPYKRYKIILSKYIACIIIFLIFLLLFFISLVIPLGIICGISSLFDPIIEYNFVTQSIIKLNIFEIFIINTLAVLPIYIITLSISFFLSTLTHHTGISISLPLILTIFADDINNTIIKNNVTQLKIFPTMCWDFREYLFGGTPVYLHASFPVSIIICIITTIIFLGGSCIIFIKKNIKNE